jgi:hypothetical protein
MSDRTVIPVFDWTAASVAVLAIFGSGKVLLLTLKHSNRTPQAVNGKPEDR